MYPRRSLARSQVTPLTTDISYVYTREGGGGGRGRGGGGEKQLDPRAMFIMVLARSTGCRIILRLVCARYEPPSSNRAKSISTHPLEVNTFVTSEGSSEATVYRAPIRNNGTDNLIPAPVFPRFDRAD